MNAILEQAIRRAKCCKAESAEQIIKIPEAPPAPAPVPEAPIVGLSVNAIIRAVASKYGFNPIEIVGERRDQSLVMARHVAIYLADRHTGLGLKRIAAFFGHRDHTSILYAIRKIAALREKHSKLDLTIRTIEDRLGCE